MSKKTIIDIFWQRVKEQSEKTAVLTKNNGAYHPVIWREHGRTVELIAGGLLKLGVTEKNTVAIMSTTRIEWAWADLAILSCGAVTVPIYPTLAQAEVNYLLIHSDAVGIFVENSVQLNKILNSTHLPPDLQFIVLLEGKLERTHDKIHLLSLEDIISDGEIYLKQYPHLLSQRITNIKPDHLASIVYTSGTTGVPKGAMLLHSNLYAVCKDISETGTFLDDDLMLSFLPLSHVFERVSGHFFPIYEGITVAYAESMESVPHNMIEVKPTIIIGVPRFFEKAYQRIQVEIRKLPQAQQYLIRWALSLGKRAHKHHAELKSSIVDHIYSTELRVADRIVFSKIRRRFGGRIRAMVAGAAPLSDEVQTFFQVIGIPILEGYGLTETAAPAFCNTLENNRFGTVGRPFSDIQVKIAEDGEIMLKGPTIFAGYYKDKLATDDCFRDGWFLTGDIGELDKDGFLKIKDRKKDIIITAGGKHVAPQYIENLFKGDYLISHVLVYGDRRKFISALITLNKEHVIEYAKYNNIQYKDYSELCTNKLIADRVSSTVDAKNLLLASFERIKRFTILPEDFSVENHELTPTLKVKRKQVVEKYRQLLDSFYSAEDLEIEDGQGSKVKAN